MKTGPEVFDTRFYTTLDTLVGRLAGPVDKKVGEIAVHKFADPDDLYYTQDRVGQYGEIFQITKYKTLGDDGQPLNDEARSFRGKGLDELTQLELIAQGVMSWYGWRPTVPDEYDYIRTQAKKTVKGKYLLDKFDELVLPTKPGLYSSFGIYCHYFGYNQNELGYDKDVTTRLTLCVQDVEKASIPYIAKRVAIGVNMAIHNEVFKKRLKFNLNYEPDLLVA